MAMKRIPLATACTLAVFLAVAQTTFAQATASAAATPPAAKPADVPVTRVVLFSSGVGYFEHNGAVNGSATSDLRFETAQINDVLKSLVVYDRGGGHVTTITYPANDPVNRTLRSFEVNLSGDPPLADILKQMRGAAISVNLPEGVAKGVILGVEQKDKIVGRGDAEKAVKVWIVNIVNDAGIRAVPLDDVRNLDILDDKIKKEMNQALAALAQARDQSKKTVTVHFDGTGRRDVGMGYLVETPVWKTTYRLMLPDPKSTNNGELQAWAIVENQTDNDWQNVTLSLVGGRPISFIELLYQPLYISRPVVSPTIIGSIMPQTYDNGILTPSPLSGINVQAPRINMQNIVTSFNQTTAGGLFSNTGGYGGGGYGGGGYGGMPGVAAAGTGGAGDPAGNPMADFTQGVAAIAEATKIGEMFHFTVDKVSLPRQQSSMIPIVAEAVKFDRLSIYSPTVSTKYALRGVRLFNGTGKYLLGGPVTVMDTVKEGHSYAGDAKIEDIPPGQSRLVSFAIDQDLTIQSAPDLGDEALLTGSIVKGTLWLKYRSQNTREYTLQNKADSEKTIILEHPRVDDFTLIEPKTSVEKTDRVYRIEAKVKAGETKTLKVVLERTRSERMELVNVQDKPLLFYVKQGDIPAKVRDVLQTVMTKRGAIADLERQINKAGAERAQILQEQANIRENLKVLPAGPSQDAAVKDLTAHDDDLKAANKQIKTLQDSLESARSDLNKFLESTTIE
jgi:hypothetical protein